MEAQQGAAAPSARPIGLWQTFTDAERAEYLEQQRLTDALFGEMADASLEEQERLGDLAWRKMKRPGMRLPDSAPSSLRRLGRFYERRQARRIIRGTRVHAARVGARQRESRPVIRHRAASSSATAGNDPGDDPEPPPRRRIIVDDHYLVVGVVA